MNYCSNCGKPVEGKFCANCGHPVEDSSYNTENSAPQQPQYQATTQNVYNTNNYYNSNISDKNWLVALLLCIFVGGFGIHRFYAGKIGTGILWLLTGGCFGIGVIVDLIMIAMSNFTDGFGRKISSNNV